MDIFEFKCGKNSIINGDNSLCFFGGICKYDNVTLSNYCECPEGFINDESLFYSKSCMPEMIYYFYTILIIIYSILLYKIFINIQIAFSWAKKVLQVQFLSIFLHVIWVICIIVQKGFKEAACIMGFISTASVGTIGVYVLLSIVKPAYATTKTTSNIVKKEVKKIWFLFFINCVGATPMLVAAFIPDPTSHNVALVTFYITSMFVVAHIIAFQIYFVTLKLENAIASTIDSKYDDADTDAKDDPLKKYLQQVQILKKSVKSFIGGAFFNTFLLVGIFFVFGSTPFQWIITFLLQLNVAVSGFFLNSFVISNEQKKSIHDSKISSKQSSTQNNQKASKVSRVTTIKVETSVAEPVD